MVDFVTAIQSVTAGVRVIKELNDLDRELDKAALKIKVAELSSALATAQVALSEAQTEAQAKDAEIAKLTDAFTTINHELVEYHGYRYRKGNNGDPVGCPYCPSCMLEGLPIMTTLMRNVAGRPHRCPKCKTDIHATHFNYPNE